MELMAKICTFVVVVWARSSIFFSFQLKLGTVLLKRRMDPDFWKKSSFFCKMSSKWAVSPIFSQFCQFLAKNGLEMDFLGANFVFLYDIVVSHWESTILTEFTWFPLISAEKNENLGHFWLIFDPFSSLKSSFWGIFIIIYIPKLTKITFFSQKCYNNHKFLSYNLLVKRFLNFSLKKLLKL